VERGNFRRLPVVELERLIGIITNRDILRRVGNPDSTKVSSVMTCDPIVVTPEMTVKEAVQTAAFAQNKRITGAREW
jgi:CBS domain-containing protein